MSKYRNKAITIDNIRFDSIREARRYQELKVMAKAGLITELRLQVPYELIPTQKKYGKTIAKKISYYADFVYRDRSGNLIVEDAKGVRTEVYKLKKKLMLYVHGIEIQEV